MFVTNSFGLGWDGCYPKTLQTGSLSGSFSLFSPLGSLDESKGFDMVSFLTLARFLSYYMVAQSHIV